MSRYFAFTTIVCRKIYALVFAIKEIKLKLENLCADFAIDEKSLK
jgi:hypothetical protein